MKVRHFKPGDVTKDVWCGDLVTECEFIRYLAQGSMLFYDRTFKCFRRAFWDTSLPDGEPILNGWDCDTSSSRYLS